jgi:hypothetical protein
MEKPTPAKAGTVQALFIDLLARPKGATIEDLKKAQHRWAARHGRRPWQISTIRSGVSWDVRRRRGYKVRSYVDPKRGRVMKLAQQPLPHVTAK